MEYTEAKNIWRKTHKSNKMSFQQGIAPIRPFRSEVMSQCLIWTWNGKVSFFSPWKRNFTSLKAFVRMFVFASLYDIYQKQKLQQIFMQSLSVHWTSSRCQFYFAVASLASTRINRTHKVEEKEFFKEIIRNQNNVTKASSFSLFQKQL